MKLDKKGGVAGFIIMIVFLILGLLAFVLFMPIGLPFIDMVAASDASPLTKFLFLGIPIFTIISLIVGTVMS